MKTHWRNLSAQPYLGSWDLEEDGKFLTAELTIEKIYTAELANQAGKQMKSFIKFKEVEKPMVCNTTNFTRLERRFKTFEYKKYIGQRIILTVEKVDSPQGKVDALRISQRAPQAQTVQKKEITDERLDDAINAINDTANEMTKESFLKVYQLSIPQQSKLDQSC